MMTRGTYLNPLSSLRKKSFRGLLIPLALHQDFEDVPLLIHRPPEVIPLAANGQEHLIEVPLVAWPRAPAPELIRVCLPELPAPLADSLVGHDDPPSEQELFHVAVAEAKPEIEPNGVADDLRRETMILVRIGWC
jgi:hypothetical protein